MTYKKNSEYTLIEELPDLEQIENNNYTNNINHNVPESMSQQYGRIIRSSANVLNTYPESGMGSFNKSTNSYKENYSNGGNRDYKENYTNISSNNRDYKENYTSGTSNTDYKEDNTNGSSIRDYKEKYTNRDYKQNIYNDVIIDYKGKKNTEHISKKYNREFNCLDICNHVNSCPLCSKIYNNNDRTVYIIIILILFAICVILMKKLLFNKE